MARSPMGTSRAHRLVGSRDYNANRPHIAHGDLTPFEFALQWAAIHQPKVV